MRIIIEVIDPVSAKDQDQMERELDAYFIDRGVQAQVEVEK